MIMDLPTVWFGIEAVLWIGYFVLEGFDFGVGLCIGLIGRKERERHAILSTIMPVWDGNEVWVIVAGGAMFAAFPGWYATLFSTFYLPLLAILVGLIIRAVGLEYREHRDHPAWRRRWDACIIAGSVLPAVLWGITFGNIVRGLPIGADQNFTGSLLDLLNPFALLAGLVTFSLFLTHGAVFLALRTTDELRRRAKRVATVAGGITVVLAVGFLSWLNLLPGTNNRAAVAMLSIITALALIFGLGMHLLNRDGWSFAGTAVTVAGVVITFFTALYPRLIPSTTNPDWSLTISNSSATHYTLTIMTWSAVVLVPLVLAYQGWTYWVFRKRITMPPVDTESAESRPVGASVVKVG
jgi:cytochrome bd ubiquinol oxidase subunit II